VFITFFKQTHSLLLQIWYLLQQHQFVRFAAITF